MGCGGSGVIGLGCFHKGAGVKPVGAPHSLAESWGGSFLLQAPWSALSHRGFATRDWIGLKLSSDAISQSDFEQDSGSCVHEEEGMGELCFLRVWELDFFSD